MYISDKIKFQCFGSQKTGIFSICNYRNLININYNIYEFIQLNSA